jgi:hypothetical protein
MEPVAPGKIFEMGRVGAMACQPDTLYSQAVRSEVLTEAAHLGGAAAKAVYEETSRFRANRSQSEGFYIEVGRRGQDAPAQPQLVTGLVL